MHFVRVSDYTYGLIRQTSQGEFINTGRREPNGDWIFPVDDAVWGWIEDNRLAGETDDDVILRQISAKQ